MSRAATLVKLPVGMTGDASGNIGMGVTPSAWESAWKAFDIGALGSVAYGYGEVDILNNLYRTNTGAYKYKTTGVAGVYSLAGTQHNFGSFASGSAGTTATIVNLLTFDKDKSLALQGAVPVTGIGITFPTAQSASSDANTLDDYEEGTLTAVLAPSSGFSPTSNYVIGYYTKVGNLVTVVAYPQMTTPASIGSYSGGDTGNNLQITGLPFPIQNNGTQGRSAPAIGVTNIAFPSGCLMGAGDNGLTSVSLFNSLQAGGTRVSPTVYANTNYYLHFCFTYRTN